MTLRCCAKDSTIGFGTLITHSEAEIGDRVYIGARCIIGMATIESDTMLADHVQLLSGKRQHGTDVSKGPFQNQPQTLTQIKIGKGCWIGANAVVMADVGERAIVGAGSVVTRQVEPRTIVGGVPSRPIHSKRQYDAVLTDSGT